MKTKTLMAEYSATVGQWNTMTEIAEVTADSVRTKARIHIELDGTYQGVASIDLWNGSEWKRAHTLVSPRGTYGYKPSSPEVFAVDRAGLLNALEAILS